MQGDVDLVFGAEALRRSREAGRRLTEHLARHEDAAHAVGGFEASDLLADHPTCKPVKLVADAILDVTARGDIVADPFLGSGTTLIAAERVGRSAHGLELDPGYCDTIVRRYQALTGDAAVHGTSGQTFDHLAAATVDQERAA